MGFQFTDIRSINRGFRAMKSLDKGAEGLDNFNSDAPTKKSIRFEQLTGNPTLPLLLNFPFDEIKI